jgi:hypothetical protein
MSEEKSTHRPFKEFVPDEAIEHMKAARAEMRKSLEAIFPPGFMEHRREARKEFLKAARSMIDATLERMEESEKK